MVVPRRALLRGRALRRGVRVLTNELAGVQWAGRRGGGGVLGREGRHGLSGLIAEGLGARHGRGVRLQRHQVCHLELCRSIEDSEETRREGGGATQSSQGWRRKAEQEFEVKSERRAREVRKSTGRFPQIPDPRREEKGIPRGERRRWEKTERKERRIQSLKGNREQRSESRMFFGQESRWPPTLTLTLTLNITTHPIRLNAAMQFANSTPIPSAQKHTNSLINKSAIKVKEDTVSTHLALATLGFDRSLHGRGLRGLHASRLAD